MEKNSIFAPLATVTRGINPEKSIIESMHYGLISVVSATGKVIFSSGDIGQKIYTRSALKPFQVLGALQFSPNIMNEITEEEIAVACGSHSGTKKHQEVVQGILKKAGLDESYLKCGSHKPFDKETASSLYKENKKPNSLHSNCSGKHALLLWAAKDKATYLDPENPLQKKIKSVIEEYSDTDDIFWGTDGCSLPNAALAASNFSKAIAKLTEKNPFNIVSIMKKYPALVSGEGLFDTELMKLGKEKFYSKTGAEGVMTLGLNSGVISGEDSAVGIVIKIIDGDTSGRAGKAVLVELMKKLGMLEIRAEEMFFSNIIKSVAGAEIGEVRVDILWTAGSPAGLSSPLAR